MKYTIKLSADNGATATTEMEAKNEQAAIDGFFRLTNEAAERHGYRVLRGDGTRANLGVAGGVVTTAEPVQWSETPSGRTVVSLFNTNGKRLEFETIKFPILDSHWEKFWTVESKRLAESARSRADSSIQRLVESSRKGYTFGDRAVNAAAGYNVARFFEIETMSIADCEEAILRRIINLTQMVGAGDEVERESAQRIINRISNMFSSVGYVSKYDEII